MAFSLPSSHPGLWKPRGSRRSRGTIQRTPERAPGTRGRSRCVPPTVDLQSRPCAGGLPGAPPLGCCSACAGPVFTPRTRGVSLPSQTPFRVYARCDRRAAASRRRVREAQAGMCSGRERSPPGVRSPRLHRGLRSRCFPSCVRCCPSLARPSREWPGACLRAASVISLCRAAAPHSRTPPRAAARSRKPPSIRACTPPCAETRRKAGRRRPPLEEGSDPTDAARRGRSPPPPRQGLGCLELKAGAR